jgi:hypothetical protein
VLDPRPRTHRRRADPHLPAGNRHPRQKAGRKSRRPCPAQPRVRSREGKVIHQRRAKALRDALYMPVLVAMRFHPDLKAKDHALRDAGKPAKLAIVTLMRKLIETANALVKADRNGPLNRLDQDGYSEHRSPQLLRPRRRAIRLTSLSIKEQHAREAFVLQSKLHRLCLRSVAWSGRSSGRPETAMIQNVGRKQDTRRDCFPNQAQHCDPSDPRHVCRMRSRWTLCLPMQVKAQMAGSAEN